MLITPFGSPVEPEVKRIFATISGRTLACSRSCVEPGLTSSNSATDADLAPTASSAGLNFAASAANTSPGCSSSKMYLSLPKSFDISEYAGEIGAAGMPTCMAPSASSAWSMLLSERMATGRSAFKF